MTETLAETLAERDARSVWHPFTQHSLWSADDPIVVDRAEGMYFWDTRGNRYLDGVSSLWVNVHGHRVPEINAAIRRQADRLDHTTFLGMTHVPAIELAERLLATAPAGLSRVFFAGDGSSAVEAALKMAYQAHAQRGRPRPLFVHFTEGYHGDTLGAVSVGGIGLFHSKYRQILFNTISIPSPGALSPGENRLSRAKHVLGELGRTLNGKEHLIAAVIVEPLVQAAGGMLTHHPSFIRGVRQLCDEIGALLICDEVATGIGRTGTMWAVDQAGISPDLLVCGKGLTGGCLPLSAVVATEDLFGSFLGTVDEARTFFHGHSYTANPIACAAAIANLDLMDARGTVEHARATGELLGELLEPVAHQPGVREVRRIGTMTGIEVESVSERTGFQVCAQARNRGVWIRPLGDVVVLMPPLAISPDQTRELVGVVAESIADVMAGCRSGE